METVLTCFMFESGSGSNLNINSNLQLKVWLVVMELRLKNCMNQENEYTCAPLFMK